MDTAKCRLRLCGAHRMSGSRCIRATSPRRDPKNPAACNLRKMQQNQRLQHWSWIWYLQCFSKCLFCSPGCLSKGLTLQRFLSSWCPFHVLKLKESRASSEQLCLEQCCSTAYFFCGRHCFHYVWHECARYREEDTYMLCCNDLFGLCQSEGKVMHHWEVLWK